MTRILLYTGKGGVGKTSIAAATALISARRGYRTMVLSTDIAHSLADAFDLPLGPEPTADRAEPVGPGAGRLPQHRALLATIQPYMAELFSWRGLDEVLAEEMTVLPGMDELGNLLWIADHVESGKYDVIVVDAAPTGETLRLLSLPEASRWWIERIAPIGRRVSRLGRPMLERMIGVPMPRDEVFAAAERLLSRLDKVHRLLADPERSSVRIVAGAREAVDRRGPALVHVLPPVRLSERPRGLQSRPARRHGRRWLVRRPARRRSSATCPRSRRSTPRCRSGRCPQFDREMIGVGAAGGDRGGDCSATTTRPRSSTAAGRIACARWTAGTSSRSRCRSPSATRSS